MARCEETSSTDSAGGWLLFRRFEIVVQKDGTSEWVVSLKRWADSDGLMLDMDVLRKFASRIEEREDKELWDGNWRELRQVYERAKAYAEFPTHSGTLDGKALEFASQWVLVESRSGDDSIRFAGDGPGEVKSKLRWTLEECVGEEKIVRKFGERQFEALEVTVQRDQRRSRGQ